MILKSKCVNVATPCFKKTSILSEHCQFTQAGEIGEAAFADDLAEVVEIAFVCVFGARGGVEFALQIGRAHV